MHDFGKLVYLDMHKTGSTTTSEFLRRCCEYDEVSFKKHAPLRRRRKPDTFYFTTVRHPQSLYKSLYRYGCTGQGGVFERFQKFGKEDLYQNTPESFAAWLKACFEPAFLAQCYPGLAHFFKLGFGLQSARHLVFSLDKPMDRIAACKTYDDAVDLYRTRQITDLVIKNETLDKQLDELALTILPQAFNLRRTIEFFDIELQLNTTRANSVSDLDSAFDGDVMTTFLEQERLLLETFYDAPEPSTSLGAAA